MKGCGSKILVFVLGMLVGIILFVGTIFGTGYYFVTQVSIGEVQEMAQQNVIEQGSEIYDMPLIEAAKFVTTGEYKTITVEQFREKFGVDLIELIANNLNVEIEEGPEKERLEQMAVMDITNNMDSLLNLFTLDKIQSQFGLDLPDFPLIQDHMEEPAILALNAIMAEFDFDDLTLSDLEYKLGVVLDAEVLQNIKSCSINGMGPALEDLALEKIIPDFDRDFYFKTNDSTYILNEEYLQMQFTEIYTLILEGEEISEEERYSFDSELNYYIQDTAGTYKKADVSFIDCYTRTGTEGNYVYTQDNYGNYMVADGTKTTERFIYDTETSAYIADSKGAFKFVSEYILSTPENSISNTLYLPKYVDFIVDNSGTLALKQYGYALAVCEADGTGKIEYQTNGGIFERNYGDGTTPDWQTKIYSIVTEGNGEEATNKLVEDNNGEYTIVHIGLTEQILKTLADCSISTINEKIGDLTISDVMEVDGDKYREITTDEKADAIFIESNKKELFVVINDLYYHYDASNTEHNALTVYLRTYKGSTHAAVKQLASVGISNIGERMDDVINSLIVSDFMEIHDDYYEDPNGGFVFINNEYVEYDEVVHGTAITRYSAPSQIIIRKMANVSIGDLGNEMQNIIDTTLLGEIITIKEENTYEEDINGEYGVLDIVNKADLDTSYYGTYEILNFEDAGVAKSKVLVKYVAGLTYFEATRYNITVNSTSPALASMADVAIGNLGTQMQVEIDNLKLNSVVEIDGDVYTPLTNETYVLALAESGDAEIYYDDNDMYRPASITTVATSFYKKVYNGATNAAFKMLATVNVSQVAIRIDDAIDDTTLYQLGIVDDSTTGILAQDNIKNSKIKNLPETINNTINNSTLRQLNEWGNLGMDETVLEALKTSNGGTDINAVDFFTNLQFNGLDINGNPQFTYVKP